MSSKNKTPIIVLHTVQGDREAQLKGLIEQNGSYAFTSLSELRSSTTPNDLPAGRPQKPGEPTEGDEAALFSALVEQQPALIILDLDNPAFDWKRWMSILKSSPATRRIPILAFANRIEEPLKASIVSRGADQIVPTAEMVAKGDELVRSLAKVIDYEAIERACSEPLSAKAIEGIELFNRGEFYDSNEELEHAWNDDSGPGRELYRGILQVAVAYLQIERGNYNGAIKMLLRVKQWLSPLPDHCRTVNVRQLREDADRVNAALVALGRDKIEQFDRSLFQPVAYKVDR